MISYLNSHAMAANCIMTIMILVGRLAGVHKNLLARAKVIHNNKQIEYALGFIAWFILYTLHWKIPKYNIYQLVGNENKGLVSKILENRLDEFRVAKQYYLLQSEDGVEEDVKESIKAFLEAQIQLSIKSTAFKTRRFNTRKAFNALQSLDGILKNEGLHPFLVSGTLLGVIRDNALIEGDNDLDIGIMSHETSSLDIFNFLVDRTEFRSVYNLGYLVQVTDRNGTVIDIFIHFREGSRVWHGTDIHKWINTDFHLKEIMFQSHTFFIPSNPHLYLDENYGDWQNPVLFWDYSFDTPNRDFFLNKKTVYYLAERIIDELSKKRPGRFPIQSAIQELNNRFDIDLTSHLGGKIKKCKRKAESEKVVITFGTFDLFHIGHLNILQRAASYGDRLVVGVSSDSMNYKKKKTRPVYCQEDRINIVSSVKHVDNVFYEESLDLKRDYIMDHGADILVMGNDWEGKFDSLSDICEVIYLSRTQNISTSETKYSIKNNL